MQTKKLDAVYLHLTGPRAASRWDRSPSWATTRHGRQRPERDVIRLKFRTDADLARGDLAGS